MQAMQAPQQPAADYMPAEAHQPAANVGRDNRDVVARLHETAVTDPSAVLGVLTFWTTPRCK
jgi:hypothetical protein